MILNNKIQLRQQALDGWPLTIKCKLVATHPALDNELENFVSYARYICFLVTRDMILERVRFTARLLKITTFKRRK